MNARPYHERRQKSAPRVNHIKTPKQGVFWFATLRWENQSKIREQKFKFKFQLFPFTARLCLARCHSRAAAVVGCAMMTTATTTTSKWVHSFFSHFVLVHALAGAKSGEVEVKEQPENAWWSSLPRPQPLELWWCSAPSNKTKRNCCWRL